MESSPLAAAGTWWFSELALRDKHQVRAYDPIYADIPVGDNTEEKYNCFLKPRQDTKVIIIWQSSINQFDIEDYMSAN